MEEGAMAKELLPDTLWARDETPAGSLLVFTPGQF
jgi:hypothetical protein